MVIVSTLSRHTERFLFPLPKYFKDILCNFLHEKPWFIYKIHFFPELTLTLKALLSKLRKLAWFSGKTWIKYLSHFVQFFLNICQWIIISDHFHVMKYSHSCINHTVVVVIQCICMHISDERAIFTGSPGMSHVRRNRTHISKLFSIFQK